MNHVVGIVNYVLENSGFCYTSEEYLIDIPRIFHPTATKYTFLSAALGSNCKLSL
jgi:hypothetical protein